VAYGQPEDTVHALTYVPDADGDQGTFRLTLIPPTASVPARPRDVVLVLDRSGSMAGWKMVAARRAASRIVDTLTTVDRFAVVTFDNYAEFPASLPKSLVQATDRNRYRAVEHLSRVDARGGTEMLSPLTTALALLTDPSRDRVLVLVTDGQVGNEDQILAQVTPALSGVRVHTVGIDEAVNAGFLGRLASVGGGRCELVESEDRLDDAMEHIHRRIGAPVVTELRLTADGLIEGTLAPARLPDVFPGSPLVITGRYQGTLEAVTVAGRRDAREWTARTVGRREDDPAVTFSWARAHLRDLEDAYAAGRSDGAAEQRIIATSLRFGVLCRFTAWIAVDTRVVTDGGEPHRVVQPVELPRGWDAESLGGPYAQMTGGVVDAAAPMMMAARTAVPLGYAASGRPRLARAKPEAAGSLALAQARSLAAEEARRLRSAAAAPEYERRELLADLGTRLVALFRQLDAAGVDGKPLASLRELAAALAGDDVATLPVEDLEALWARALTVLEEFGGVAKRKAFWKI
jgi:Ca-activated chloride channel family protein